MLKAKETRRRHKWRGRTKLYALGALASVSALIYWEQAALLYVASTLFISVVLIVVAFANLERKDAQFSAAATAADAAEVSEKGN
jgi:hypothetical protein